MNNILNNYYAAILFLALIFFIISKYNSSVLIALIIIIIFYYHIDNSIKHANATKKNRADDIVDNIDKGIDTIKELNTNNFNININTGNIKFLKKNKEFLDIIHNMRFVKKFDKTRYNNLIIYMNKLMKIYIYILSDRYDIYTHDLSAPISDRLIDKIGKVDYIVNMASESHVDRSITDPVDFCENNFKLALNMLEYAHTQ
jgi:hypothetical protein